MRRDLLIRRGLRIRRDLHMRRALLIRLYSFVGSYPYGGISSHACVTYGQALGLRGHAWLERVQGIAYVPCHIRTMLIRRVLLIRCVRVRW